jgi:hypothetical protein
MSGNGADSSSADEGGTVAAAGEATRKQDEPSPFPHPPWTVGVVLVLGVVSLLFGLLVRPIFLAVGSPFIIVLVLWLYVKLFTGGEDSS